jgi:heat shock protein HslJ/uncharacterized lipoprotein NlpE involved in copper resistance
VSALARRLLVAASLAGLAGCAAERPLAIRPDVAGSGPDAVTYAGTIPCADCAGQRITLTLFADGTFRLRRVYLGVAGGGDADQHELGRWTVEVGPGGRLVLSGGTEGPRQFLPMSTERLRVLDRDGREIRSTLSYDLVRATSADLLGGPMRLRGMYTYMADAAVLDECFTGRRFPVSLEAGHVELERAYLQQRRAPGEPILASVTGRFVQGSPEPGAPPRERLVVERFDRLLPGESCAGAAAPRVGLLNTYWRAVEIDGQRVPARATVEPHLVLSADGNGVRGSTGCNRLTGRFEQGADELRFKALATTRMACASPAREVEAPFLAALGETTSQRIVGETLELRDARGTVRIRLEARPPR